MAPGQEDFDMAEYEVLEHCSTEELQSQTLWPSKLQAEPTTTTPWPSPPSASPTQGPAPQKQEEGEDVGRGVQVGSRSPQLKQIKKKAPEVLPV